MSLMINIETSVQNLTGVGPKMQSKLERLGIKTIRDLLFYYPRDWQDFSKPQPIKQLRINEEAIIEASIFSIRQTRTFRKRMSIVEAKLVDDSGEIRAIWFNQAFLAKVLKPSQKFIFSGKIGYDFKTREKTLSVSQYEKNPVILPVYPETEGITSKYIRRLTQGLIEKIDLILPDYLPAEILKEEKLIDLPKAVSEIHFPRNSNQVLEAKNRLAFDELFLIGLLMTKRRALLQQEAAVGMKIDKIKLKQFVDRLPFKLTDAQRRAAWEIILDLSKKTPMNRLLEGDVGSGKTVVATMAVYVTFLNKMQSVWLAPTEILANQHFYTVRKILEPFGVKVGLLTSANKKADLENDDLIIGTHALLQKDIKLRNLNLIIIDEQHRFGVEQRAHLRKVNHAVPHLLSMTATPIPRSLALSLYGDLDLSTIDELPPGRQKVDTFVVKPSDRQKAYNFIRKEISSGRQVFVICPLIEEGRPRSNQLFDLDKRTVVGEYTKLSKEIFSDLSIAMLHGRMKSKEKEKIMANFKDGKTDILVSTAVIEVGIDIPNATVMMIENADRFGLAQLHQFRGRVGRGQHKSYCFLFSESFGENSSERLKAMTTCDNGFELAEVDLKMRGPGELVGIRQSGLPDLKMASLRDIIMVKRARNAAEKIWSKGIENYPQLGEKLSSYEKQSYLD